jgi:hypothetical protein
MRRAVLADAELVDAKPARESDAIAIAFRDPEERSANRFIGVMICVGLLNAFIASLIFCRLPASHASNVAILFLRAVIYVAITAAAGVAGTRFYWSNPSGLLASAVPVSFPLFALIGASAWVLLPAAILFSPQDSPASPLIVTAATAILARGLRKAIPAQVAPDLTDHELFVGVLRRPSRSADGYIIAACIYLALFAIAVHQSLNAGAPLAVCAWLLAWKLTRAPGDLSCTRDQISGAVRRLGWTTAAAICATFVALLFGVEHRNRVAAMASSGAGTTTSPSDCPSKKSHHAVVGAAGYESIILSPQPEKTQIVPPLPSHLDLLPPEAKRPLILSFTGSYWYFQAPNSGPGLTAHLARGTPLGLNIQSSNNLPLTMEAHQRLAGSIRLARCREIQITLANSDNHPRALAVAVLLSDSALRGQPTIYLGQQPINTSGLESSASNDSPRDEVLRFEVPERATVREFDTIAVMFLADPLHQLTAPRMAIEQFDIVPR